MNDQEDTGSASDESTGDSSSRSETESTDSSTADKQLLVQDSDPASGNEDDDIALNEKQLDADEESEDEKITHTPINAREVIQHNKWFGKKTADYWWVHGDKVYSDYFVALLRPMTQEEITASSREDIRDLKKELANDPSLTDTLQDFEKILSRFEVKLNRQPSVPSGDPNQLPFQTPYDFIPTDMRKWIVNWEPFNFELDPWPMNGPVDLADSSQEIAHCFRPWLDDWEPFDTEITGDSAWKQIQPDLFAKDILTKKQKETLQNRENRKDMNDQNRIIRRRKKLMDYFQSKYRMTDAELEKYSHFLPSLEQNAAKLLSLCQ